MSLQVAKPILGGLAQACGLKEVRCDAQVRVAYLDSPCFTLLVPPHAGNARLVCLLKRAVSSVFGVCCLAKITQPIVAALMVYVVNFIRWHVAVYVKPREAMQAVTTPLNTNPAIPVTIVETSHIADMNAVTRTMQVGKYPGLGAIVQKIFQVRLAKFHGAPRMHFGIGAGRGKLPVPPLYSTVWG